MLVLPSAEGRLSFSASWHRHAGAQPFCLWGWLCASPGLVEAAPAALSCPAHTGAVAQPLVWPVSQVSAGQNLCPWDLALLPRASGMVGMWDLYTAPCTARLCCHTRAGEWGCPRPGNHPAHGCYHVLSIHWCFSLTPLPFTAQKCLQQIDMGAAGVSSAKELKCAVEPGPSVAVLYAPA